MTMRRLALLAAVGSVLAVPALAQSGDLTLDLNSVETTQAGCRATLVGHNGLADDLEQLAFEIVLFDADGLVVRMLALDLGAMHSGRTKVMQFTLPGTQCDSIGRVLINDVQACEGPGDSSACLSALVAESRSGLEFGL